VPQRTDGHTPALHIPLMTHATTALPLTGAPDVAAKAAAGSEPQYVCPMHAQIVRRAPGACPICGMSLELRVASGEDEPNTELVAMKHRLWWTAGPAALVFLIAMSDMLPGMPMRMWLGAHAEA